MTAPSCIIQLIDHFHSSINSYRAGSLNETQTRIEFIDPFFAALGWDIRNEQQASDIYKDVVHEDSLKITDAKKAKAPDYSFRVGGIRKFFVEAKKPAVNVGTNISAAFQLRRYGWSAKLPLSILTDFEEFAVYDCRIMPNKNDSASTARIKHFNYTEYGEKWEEIYSLFSKEAVLSGSLEKFAETKVKSGITVDKAFLQEIENWRENLAANIAWRNLQIQQRELNFAVQMTINRIVFLRICEDRGIEIYEQLFNLLRLENIYEELGRLFRNADYRYNSGLFHFQTEKGRDDPDDFTLNLKIDDTTLKPIIRKLYLPESPYEFSVIPYELTNGNVHLINEDKLRNNYPLTCDYLIQNKQFLENREKGKMLGSDWYAYIYPKNIELMKKSKILVPDIANRASFAWDEQGDYAFTSGYGIILKNNVQESIKYILGLLNSKVLNFYLKNISTTMRGGFFRYFTKFIEQLPIRLIDFSNSQEKNIHNHIIQLVEQMLYFHKQLNEAQTPPAKKRIQQQINATDRQINQLVYELYGLTDEEIAIVKGA